jgi:hypothetical protein
MSDIHRRNKSQAGEIFIVSNAYNVSADQHRFKEMEIAYAKIYASLCRR